MKNLKGKFIIELILIHLFVHLQAVLHSHALVYPAFMPIDNRAWFAEKQLKQISKQKKKLVYYT